MRGIKTVLSALVVAGLVGNTALAASDATPASGAALNPAVVHSKPIHKAVTRKKITKKAKINNKTTSAFSRHVAALGAQ